MTKKLLSAAIAALFFSSAAYAQVPQLTGRVAPPLESRKVIDFTPANTTPAKTTSATTGDTLWYFFYKHILKNPNNTLFNAALCPQSSTFQITQYGSVFLNTGTMSVTGLECIAARVGSSPSASVTIRMYLGNVAPTSPYILSLPLIDSLDVVATGTGGAIRGANFATPKIVSGNFAVLFRCISTQVGDSALLYMNNAKVAGSTPTAQAYGEGLSFIRVANSLYQNAGLWGTGTDREYCVAPRVQYTVNTAMATSTVAVCAYTPTTFNNTSNFRLSHRQYNFNEFYRHWRPFANQTQTISADSVFEWNFGDNSPIRYTPSSQPSVSKFFTTAGVYTVTLTSNLRKTGNLTDPVDLTETATGFKTVNACDVGLSENGGFDNLSVFPNPTAAGRATVSGLSGQNAIAVYNLLGQPISSQLTDRDTVQIDLQQQPEGSYFIKITNMASNAVKVVKVVNHH